MLPTLDMSSPRKPFTRWGLLRVMLLVACTVMALAAAEIAARITDGYRLTSLRLEVSHDRLWPADPEPRSGPQKWRGDADAWPYVRQLPVTPGVDREWFASRPPDRGVPRPDADLEARAKRYKGDELYANYEWNWEYVVNTVCRGEHRENKELFNRLDDIYVFDPTDGSESPTYRFLRNVTYPTGLRTNTFGWRGPDIPLNKPPRTIRIAFVGASTTVGPHGEPYSYPELVGLWLNRWMEAHHLDISIDAINAGREGVNSRSIQAVVRQEAVPVEPDLVVYYEGSNQFWPADFISTTLPPRSRLSGPQPSVLASYSVIARRVESVVRHAVEPGFEPPKPPLVVNWPPDLDERDPDLAHPHLPIELPHILGDLEIMRRAVDEEGGRFVMTSFVWLVYPGLVLDPVRDAFAYDYLNTMFWPFTYAQMRRFLDFQTQAFRKYAAVHGLDFIDLVAAYPRDPRLFDDGIHMTRAGIHLQAWIAFNGIVPIIERQLASHAWPRPVRHALSRHPAFGERRLVSMTEVRATCNAAAR